MSAALLDAAALADIVEAVGEDAAELLAECSRANVAAYLADNPGDRRAVRPACADDIRAAARSTLRAGAADAALAMLRDGMRDDSGFDHAPAGAAFALARLAAIASSRGSADGPTVPRRGASA